MSFDFDGMLHKIKDRQWALVDIDWDAPGAETISPELHAKLKPFMSDLMWIENVGARGFAAMALKAPTETLRDIYRHFHAEEQKHANAELALMRRWGMLDGDEMPEPNINVKLVIDWLDKHSDGLSLSILGTVIPMLEVALDGALVKFIMGRDRGSGLSGCVQEDQCRRVQASGGRFCGDRDARALDDAQARCRNRRRLVESGVDHRDTSLHPAAEQDARQHRRHGSERGTALHRDEAIQERRRTESGRAPRPDVSGG